MIDFDLSQMSADSLAQSFAEKARLVHCFKNYGAPAGKRTPESDAITQEIRVIGAELRKRNSVAQARALMEHEDRNVCAWAASHLDDLDPEWAGAASAALSENVTTREALAFREHVRRGPLPGPSLEDSSLEQLLARYEDAGIRRSRTQFMPEDDEDPCNVDIRNATIQEMIDVGNELKRRGALPILLPLTHHPNDSIRCNAAALCLSFAPDHAVPILEALRRKPKSTESMAAMSALWMWRSDQKKE